MIVSYRTSSDKYRLGQRVRHAKFGEGVVLNYEDIGQGRVQIRFHTVGVKWLACQYAALELISG